MSKRSAVDLNNILRVCNTLCVIFAIYFCLDFGPNQYIDWYSVILLIFFSIQNHWMLIIEKKSRDPYIVLLIFNIIFFYMLRVVTLLYEPWSTTLSRFNLNSSDVNYAFFFIMISVLSIFAGLKSVKRREMHCTNKEECARPQRSPIIIIGVLIVPTVFYYIINNVNVGLISSVVGYFIAILDIYIVQMFALVYVIFYFHKISRHYICIIGTLIIGYVFIASIAGSRAGIVASITLIIISSLAAQAKVTINRKLLFTAFLLIPILFFTFGYATYSRSIASRVGKSAEEVAALRPSATEYMGWLSEGGDDLLLFELRRAFDRVGNLDMATDILINHDEYNKVINPLYYFSSTKIIPGFNEIFMPRAAHNLQSIYKGDGLFELSEIDDNYQSDMFTVFGEYYVLFWGYPAVFVFYFCGYCFKKIYISLARSNSFLNRFYTACILYVFYQGWLQSFGMDWLTISLVKMLSTVIILTIIYKTRFAPARGHWRPSTH